MPTYGNQRWTLLLQVWVFRYYWSTFCTCIYLQLASANSNMFTYFLTTLICRTLYGPLKFVLLFIRILDYGLSDHIFSKPLDYRYIDYRTLE
jgi:hypothetical protein